MSHESQGLRVIGQGYIQRLGTTEQPVLGPLPLEYLGAAPKSDRKTVMDPRPSRRGQVLFALTDPKEPEGKLTVLSAPPKLLALLLAGSERTVAVAAGSVTGEAHSYVGDFAFQLAQRHVSAVVLTPGVRATLATGVEGNNNAITWTAVAAGTVGNAITIALVNPGTASAALGVVVSATDIVVNLATSGASAITSTAAQVQAAIAASAAAAALVTTANTGASTGAAAVVAVAETALASGSNAGTPWSAGTDYEVLDAHEGLIRPLLTGTMGAAGACLAAYSHAAIGGTAVDLGTDTTIRARVWMNGYNDTDADQAPVRWECADALLSPNGELNLVGTDPAKIEFTLTPLTPEGATSPVELSFPVYAA